MTKEEQRVKELEREVFEMDIRMHKLGEKFGTQQTALALMEIELPDILVKWFFDEVDREVVDELKDRIQHIEMFINEELPIIDKGLNQRLLKLQARLGHAKGLVEKREKYEALKDELRDWRGSELPISRVKDLRHYAILLQAGKDYETFLQEWEINAKRRANA